MSESATWVVTIRVWCDPEPVRVRVLIGDAGGGDPIELVATSIDDACSALASYLTERLGG